MGTNFSVIMDCNLFSRIVTPYILNNDPIGIIVLVCSVVLFLLENPIILCVPSQNGLFFDPPQRHNAIPAIVPRGSPLEFKRLLTTFGWRSFIR